MRNRFDEQLELLNVELIRMGAQCEDAIALASRTLMGEVNLVSQVHAAEREIDQKERDIENLCFKLLLHQQPVARDLRLVSAALKMISDMERIGDQASDIAEIAEYMEQSRSQLESQVHIKEMADAVIDMVTASIDSFVKKDLAIAKQVIESDDKVDDLFAKVKEEIISLIASDSSYGEVCLDLLMVAKYFERIGDHATNIAEWVEFSITGSHIGD
ncbi:MAG: phosphate signaling complex protein PhoU [Lachnospiraceae bacterium]